MIAYRAMLDVPRELVRHLAGLLAAERRGTRRNTRALSCWYHALLVLVWYRNGDDLTRVRGIAGHRLPLPRRGHPRARRDRTGPARRPTAERGQI